MKGELYFDQVGNLEGVKKKLLEFNAQSNILDEGHLVVLDELLEMVKSKATYNQTKISKKGFEVIKQLLQFPPD